MIMCLGLPYFTRPRVQRSYISIIFVPLSFRPPFALHPHGPVLPCPAAAAQDLVEAEFRYVYGDDVAAVNPVWDQSELEPLLDEFNQVRCKGG
jgi:hypothetical protein